ncbi:hypothetical protein PCANC_26217 [Puccinia coronata f. sp. avenae]|uniref:Secreted protein n=1 Tax=Puccinia coronata f. sp. avenae TaxID=200324 RepID=A0A2N5RX41_9BASI|nr:hypothetical protein PCANC_26217 [Puccinia coronata f. sp. avenae]
MVSFSALVAAAITGFVQISYTSANADPSTGHFRHGRPTVEWLQKNKPDRVTREIQASECGMNTRLAYPHVQLFALFQYNHKQDNYHGCPYGDCLAFTTFPQPEDMEVDYRNSMSFFWHDVGGKAGTGVKLISDPQTGAFGYEKSITGKFSDGPTPANTIQKLHDANYPGFHSASLPRWPKGAADRLVWAPNGEPKHPVCARPCEENRDPGMNPGVYGSSEWKPARSIEDPPPAGYQCPKNGTVPVPVPNQCNSFCGCVAACKGDDGCIAQCNTHNKGKCQASQCQASPAPSPNPPRPGNDPDKCTNYCSCLHHHADGTDSAENTKKCHHIRKGCEDHQCPKVAPPPPSGSNTTDPSSKHTEKKHHSGHHGSDGDDHSNKRHSRKEARLCL